MSILAHTTSPLLSPDTNPLLRFLLKHTFYAQFCAGSTQSEISHTVSQIRSIGLNGVILNYAKEVALDKSKASSIPPATCVEEEVKPWADGTLETVRMTRRGDFAALKFTGAGQMALYDLAQNKEPSPALKEAIDAICDLAAERGVRLLFDAEQYALQPGIDAWTLEYMRRYNGGENGKEAVIYGTYQAYLKCCPEVLASHLKAAAEGGFILGVKLVRGAYLGSDPRELIHDTKEDTDACYDGLAEGLARRRWGGVLREGGEGEMGLNFPNVSVMLAGHNIVSVRKMMAVRREQARRGERRVGLVYAQLQGMADEVSCELVLAAKSAAQEIEGEKGEKKEVDVPETYKYLVWGTTGQCMKYLLRRAYENKDAIERTREGRNAMAGELWRRVRGGVGLRG